MLKRHRLKKSEKTLRYRTKFYKWEKYFVQIRDFISERNLIFFFQIINIINERNLIKAIDFLKNLFSCEFLSVFNERKYFHIRVTLII